MNYPLVMMTPELEDAYGPIFGLPTSVLIARDGSVCKRHFGPMSGEQLERESQVAPVGTIAAGC